MHSHKSFASIFSLSDLSRRRRITLIVLRVLTLVVAAALLVMGIAANRSYMIWFSSSLIIILLIPEVTIEMLFRDFAHSGIYNLSHEARLIISPFIYAIICALSPLLFHGFFNLFSSPSRTMGGNTTSLQLTICQTLYNYPLVSFSAIFIVIALLYLLAMLGLCYLTLSSSKYRRLTAISLFILMEAAAALAACNSPG